MTTSRRALLAAALLGGCAPAELASGLSSAEGLIEERGLAYGPEPRQRADLYAPRDPAPNAPLIVFLHGGSWRMGSRVEHAFVGRPLAHRGAVVVVPDYRLWPEVAFPEFLADSARAFDWARRQAPGRRAHAMGHSAGAFNAAAIALDPAWGVRAHCAGLIGLAGPYAFAAAEVRPPDIFGGRGEVRAVPPGVSLAGAPPLLLLHGEADRVVRPEQSAWLAARARAEGVPVTHRVYPGVGHIGVVAALAAPVRALGLAGADVLGEVGRFVAA